jgi:hypothetical protein
MLERMTSILGFDTESSLPPHAVIAAGGHFVGGYVSDTPGKNMTKEAYQAYRAAGLSVILFAENGEQDWQMSAAEAHAFGQRCRVLANAIGHGPSRPIFVSIDTELSPAQIVGGADYVLNFARGAGGAAGGYGQNNLGRYCLAHGVSYWVQSAAWDDSAATHAQVFQCRRGPGQPLEGFNVVLPGTTFNVDYDWAVTADFGQDPLPTPPAPVPAPKPPAPKPTPAPVPPAPPAPTPTPKPPFGVAMQVPVLVRGNTGPTVAAVERLLSIPVTSVYDEAMAQALALFCARHNVAFANEVTHDIWCALLGV